MATRDELRLPVIRSGALQLAGQILQVALTVGSAMALARLLTPGDFGVLAMAYTLIGPLSTIKDFGFTAAAVQREGVDDRQLSALFWVALRLNLLTTIAVACLGPVLARIYGEPRLTAIVPALGLALCVLGLGTLHQALLMRRLQFGRLTVIEIASVLGGIAAGVGSALLGAGAWSLVAQFVATSATKCAGMWLACDWRPSGLRSGGTRDSPDIDSLRSYGRHLTGIRILAEVGRYADRAIVGFFSGANAAGFYDNARRWSLYPVQQLNLPLSSVAVAGLSRVQGDPATYRRWAQAGLLPVFSLAMPALTFMAVEAPTVIPGLLGPQWGPAIPLFRVLCVAALAGSVSGVTRWLYLARGEPRAQFRWALLSTPLIVVAAGAGVPWGPYGVALGVAAATALLTYPGVASCLEGSPLTAGDVFRVAARPALASVAAAVGTAFAGPWLAAGGVAVELAVKGLLFLAVYSAAWAGLPGGRTAAADLFRLARAALPARTPPR
jgi:PST family polysaccharide transporter